MSSEPQSDSTEVVSAKETPIEVDKTSVFKAPARVKVALQLMYLDPEGRERYFPLDTPVRIKLESGKELMPRPQCDMGSGAWGFKVKRSEQSFTVEIVFDEETYIVNEPLGLDRRVSLLSKRSEVDKFADTVAQRKKLRSEVDAAKGETTDTAEQAELETDFDKCSKQTAAYRVFELPKKITLKNTDWKVTSKYARHYKKAEFKFDLETDKPDEIGTRNVPCKLVLDPHWQYLRFEYFDRYYGHGDKQKHKPVSLPPILIEGYDGEPGKLDADVTKRAYKSRSNWVSGSTEYDATHCIPWIIQRSADGTTAAAKPDADTTLAFLTDDEHRYIKSVEPLRREFAKLEQADADKPCADRLRYYDLPAVWKSRLFWCRLSDEDQGEFKSMVTKQTSLKQPLALSLDDIVLVDKDLNPFNVTDEDERVAVFYHEFKKPDGAAGGRDGAKYSNEGVYKVGPTREDASNKARADAETAEIEKQKAPARKQAEDKAREEEKLKAARAELSPKQTAKVKRYGAQAEKMLEKRIQERAQTIVLSKSAEKRIKRKADQAANAVVLDMAKVTAAGDAAAGSADTASDKGKGYPYSQVELRGSKRNYVADYPHWTRLVIVEGDSFEAFAARTEQDTSKADDATRVVGARAGVRWVKSAKEKSPSEQFSPRPKATKKPFFSIQPFFEHEFDHSRFTTRKHNGSTPYLKRYKEWSGSGYDGGSPHYWPYSNDAKFQCGRFDTMLLRCCGHKDDDEKSTVLNFFRFSFKFTTTGSLKSGMATKAQQAEYKHKALVNIMQRWNGPDSYLPADRALVEPREKTTPETRFAAQVIRFLQEVPDARAHIRLEVVNQNRCDMGSYNGIGHFKDSSPNPGGDGDFAAAHECGHAGGLEDEYTERWTTPSYFQPSFRGHLPGDPFLPDGTHWAGVPGVSVSDADVAASSGSIMKNNVRPRARHFWMQAEWLQMLYDKKFQVKFNSYTYVVEHHKNNANSKLNSVTFQRTFAFWPRAMTAGADNLPTVDGKKPPRYNAFLYQLGTDYYTKQVLPAKSQSVASALSGVPTPSADAYDGLLIVQVNLDLDWNVSTDHVEIRDNLAKMTKRVAKAHNFRNWASFQAGAPFQFNRCLLHFSPRFIVTTFSNDHSYCEGLGITEKSEYDSKVSKIRQEHGFHVSVIVDQSTSKHSKKRGFDLSNPSEPSLYLTYRDPWGKAVAQRAKSVAGYGKLAWLLYNNHWQGGPYLALDYAREACALLANAISSEATGAAALTKATQCYDQCKAVATAAATEAGNPGADVDSVRTAADGAKGTDTSAQQIVDVLAETDADDSHNDAGFLSDYVNLASSIAEVVFVVKDGIRKIVEGKDHSRTKVTEALTRADAKINEVTPVTVKDKAIAEAVPDELRTAVTSKATTGTPKPKDVRDEVESKGTTLKNQADQALQRAKAELTRATPPPIDAASVKGKALSATVPAAITTAANAPAATAQAVHDAVESAVHTLKEQCDKALTRADEELKRIKPADVRGAVYAGWVPGEVSLAVKKESERSGATPKSVRDKVKDWLDGHPAAGDASEASTYAWDLVYIVEDVRDAAKKKYDDIQSSIVDRLDVPQTDEVYRAAYDEADAKFLPEFSKHMRQWLGLATDHDLTPADYENIVKNVADPPVGIAMSNA